MNDQNINMNTEMDATSRKRMVTRNGIVIFFALVILVAVVAFGVMRTTEYGASTDESTERPTPPREDNLGAESQPPGTANTSASMEQEISEMEELEEAYEDLGDTDIDF